MCYDMFWSVAEPTRSTFTIDRSSTSGYIGSAKEAGWSPKPLSSEFASCSRCHAREVDWSPRRFHTPFTRGPIPPCATMRLWRNGKRNRLKSGKLGVRIPRDAPGVATPMKTLGGDYETRVQGQGRRKLLQTWALCSCSQRMEAWRMCFLRRE